MRIYSRLVLLPTLLLAALDIFSSSATQADSRGKLILNPAPASRTVRQEVEQVSAFSSLVVIPDHTSIDQVYERNICDAMNQFPSGLSSALFENGIRIKLAGNVHDAYYYYYPRWKEDDYSRPVDPNKPIPPMLEKKDGVWIDNRKHENWGGVYIDKRMVLPQQFIEYGTNNVIDRTNSKAEIKAAVFHESWHGIDDLYKFSDDEYFIRAYNQDKEKFSEEKEKEMAYFVMSGAEAFAEIATALTGGLPKERAKVLLDAFPLTAEHIKNKTCCTDLRFQNLF